MYIGLDVKYMYCPILSKIEFFDRFSKYIEISNFTKIYPVRAELFNADRRTSGQTDMTMLITVFRKFSKASNNILSKNIPDFLLFCMLKEGIICLC